MINNFWHSEMAIPAKPDRGHQWSVAQCLAANHMFSMNRNIFLALARNYIVRIHDHLSPFTLSFRLQFRFTFATPPAPCVDHSKLLEILVFSGRKVLYVAVPLCQFFFFQAPGFRSVTRASGEGTATRHGSPVWLARLFFILPSLWQVGS